MTLEGYEIRDWNTFKGKMEELGYREVGSSSVPYQVYKYARRGPHQTAFSKSINREVDVPYVFEGKATRIKRVDKVVVFIENHKIDQVRLKFDIDDWPHHTDLNIIHPEHRKILPSELEELIREIEEEIKIALR